MSKVITYQSKIETKGTPKIIAEGDTYYDCMENTLLQCKKFELHNIQFLELTQYEYRILFEIIPKEHDEQQIFIDRVIEVNSNYKLREAMNMLFEAFKTESCDYIKACRDMRYMYNIIHRM